MSSSLSRLTAGCSICDRQQNLVRVTDLQRRQHLLRKIHETGDKETHFKSKNSWRICHRTLLRLQVTVRHQEEVGKCCAKISPIDVSLILAPWEVYILIGVFVREICEHVIWAYFPRIWTNIFTVAVRKTSEAPTGKQG